jgi:16S rRNA (guanine527-N7)-methyltransferase
MAVELPSIGRDEFWSRLSELTDIELSSDLGSRLFLHYQELRRWNRVTSLVGPGTASEVLERHYAESLVALGLLGEGASNLVDIGSGAGFPGLVLAAAREDLDVTLTEANQKKWSFLTTAARKMSLPCNCLNARVGATSVESLPPRIDIITSRAVSESDLGLYTLLPRLSSRGSVLLWVGEGTPKTPKNFILKQEVPLARSRARRIIKIGRE